MSTQNLNKQAYDLAKALLKRTAQAIEPYITNVSSSPKLLNTFVLHHVISKNDKLFPKNNRCVVNILNRILAITEPQPNPQTHTIPSRPYWWVGKKQPPTSKTSNHTSVGISRHTYMWVYWPRSCLCWPFIWSGTVCTDFAVSELAVWLRCPVLCQFFNQVLMLGKTSVSDLSEHVFDLILELYNIDSHLLLSVLPQLEFKLKVPWYTTAITCHRIKIPFLPRNRVHLNAFHLLKKTF